jgi:hypothetical protein
MIRLKAIETTGIFIIKGKTYKIIDYDKKKDHLKMMLGRKCEYLFEGTYAGSTFSTYFGKLPCLIDNLNKNIKIL